MAMTDMARLAQLALNKYIKKKVQPIFRRSYLMNEMKSRNKISFNNGGNRMEWRPEKRRRDLTWGPGNPNTVTFPITNIHTTATLDWKTCFMGEAVREIEILALKDRETAFFGKQEEIADRCTRDFITRFGPKLYADGVGTDVIDGLESWGGTDGAITDEPVAEPSDTYGGLSTVRGAEGDWDAPSDGDWPRCGTSPESCDYEYHYWSPLIVDYNDSDLVVDSDNESAGWDDCWVYACRYLTTYMNILQSESPDAIILCPDLLRRARNSLKKDQQFQLSDKSKKLDAGIDVLTFEGTEFATEFGVPPGIGYAVNFDHMELKCMGDQLVKTMNDTDIVTADKLYRFSWHGNLWIDTPAFFGFLKPTTTLST